MYRGSTPTHTFRLPSTCPPDMIKEYKITYVQNGNEILSKKSADCTTEGNAIVVKLSQEDTFLFKKGVVTIQLRVLTLGNDCIISKDIEKSVKECLDSEVLV